MGLRNADTSSTRRFTDGDDWLVLRIELSQGERNALAQLGQSYRLPLEGTTDFGIEQRSLLRDYQRSLFEILAVDWSLKPGTRPTAADYEALDEASGEWVDECMDKVLEERRKRAEGNGSASKTPAGSGTRRRKAASSA